MYPIVRNRKLQGSLWLALFFGASILLPVLRGNAQTAGTASIQGAVTDGTGAVIGNADVTATNTATQVKHKATSDGSGLYSFPNISIGTYDVEATAPGFNRYRQSNIVLDVGSSIAINIVMKVGGEQQTVEVRASDLALQTEDSTLKQTVDEQTLTEMPLNGREMTNLVTLMGGAVNANANNDVQGSKTFYSSAVISITGGQGNFSDYRLDGADNNDYQTNINLPFPFPDAVAQFSVETTDLGASSGLHPGGLVNVVTRSGSNQWHGSGFEFIRNNFIDATNFFSVNKDTLHQNQYGGTFGGRIIRDKLFAFAGYQHTKADQAQASTQAYVPTAANLQGDFSVTDGPGCPGGPIQVLNPQTGAVLPDNQINPSFFSPTSLALLKYFPAPTNNCGLVTFAIPSETAENQFVTRVDWTISPKHSAYGRYWVDGYQHPSFYSPNNILITGQSGNFERVQALTLGETYVLTQNIVNSFHATGTIRDIRRGPASTGINANTIGIDMFSSSPVQLPITATDKWTIYSGAPAIFNENTFSFADDVTWIHGKHQIGFGGEYARSQFNENNVYDGNGTFGFSGIFARTGPNGSSAGGTGSDANLDFLTGALHSFAQSNNQQDALRAPIPTLYVMDTYHLTNKIVLTGGLRWGPEYFPTDNYGRGSEFSMANFMGNVHSTAYPNAPAGELYYGDPGIPKAFTTNSVAQFSPRIGATYDPTGTGKTVFRVGASMVYDTVDFFMGQNMNENPPFSETISTFPVTGPLNFAAPWSNGSVTANPFPRPPVPSSSTPFQLGAQYIELAQHYHPPVMLQYTASVQREFSHGWQVQIDYVGNRTEFNSYASPMDDDVYIPGMCNGSPCSTTGNDASRFALTIANPSQGPYFAGGGNESNYVLTGANSSYNGVVTSAQHRLSSSFVLMANYTWSHCIDISDNVGDTEGTVVQNPNNIKGDKANCGFDFRDVFNSSLVASSHFNLSNRLASEVVNHWEIAPLVHFQDGNPFTVLTGQDNSLTDTGNDRPNLTSPDLAYTHKKIQSGPATNASYLSSDAFTPNELGTFGTLGRNSFRGPKFLQVDSALSRAFSLHEGLQLHLRIEAFNLLNHPDFATPSNSGYIGGSTSLASSIFGDITSTVNNYGARIFQGALKITF